MSSALILSAAALRAMPPAVRQAVFDAALLDGGPPALAPTAREAVAPPSTTAFVDATGLAHFDPDAVFQFMTAPQPVDPVSERLLRAFAAKAEMSLTEILTHLPDGYDLRALNGFRSGMTRRATAMLGKAAQMVKRRGDSLYVAPETSRALDVFFNKLTTLL